MDTHKIIIAIVILTLFVLVLYFCNKTKPLETFYRWTRDQKTRSFDLFLLKSISQARLINVVDI